MPSGGTGEEAGTHIEEQGPNYTRTAEPAAHDRGELHQPADLQ